MSSKVPESPCYTVELHFTLSIFTLSSIITGVHIALKDVNGEAKEPK